MRSLQTQVTHHCHQPRKTAQVAENIVTLLVESSYLEYRWLKAIEHGPLLDVKKITNVVKSDRASKLIFVFGPPICISQDGFRLQ
jgi:hypothetical protein